MACLRYTLRWNASFESLLYMSSKNPYAQELLRQCLTRYSTDSVNMPMSEWLTKNTKHKGLPFNYNRYPYQEAVVDDNHPNQVGIKPSQVGWSEIIQRWSLGFLKRNRGTKGIYAYPDDDMRQKNVQTRVLPLADDNAIFNQGEGKKPIRSIQLIQIDYSFLYMTGSKEGDATSTDADFVVIDEYDLHDPDMQTLFRSRVLNSDWAYLKNFSTPTFTEFGVDQSFEASDQMWYMIKCDGCGHWQFPLFTPAFIKIKNLSGDIADLLEVDQGMIDTMQLDIPGSYVCCEKCRARLDLGRRDNREWVAKYPSRTHLRGRRVNPFSVSTRPPAKIFTELHEYRRKGRMKGFKNTVLGLAEDSSSARITEQAIRACFRGRAAPEIRLDVPVRIGIDVGHTPHITVGQGWTDKSVECVAFITCHLRELKSVVKVLLDTYNVVGGMIDRHPESQMAEDIRDMSGNRIMPCEYRGEAELNIVQNAEKEPIYTQANRTILLDAVQTAINRKTMTFAGYGMLEDTLVVHFRNMVREEVPEKQAVWKKLDSQDHFFHSTGFMLKSFRLSEVIEIKYGVPQSAICVAGATIGGYNTDIYGQHTKKATTPWQAQFLLR